MGRLVRDLRESWSIMLEPPWRHSGPHDGKADHWLLWLLGWAWAIAGLVLGAFVAPSLAQKVGLANTQYENWFEIAVSVVAGFLVQLGGWVGVSIAFVLGYWLNVWGVWDRLPAVVGSALEGASFLIYVLPLAAVGYAFYRFFALVGPGQKLVTTAAVGGFLVKAFLIPLIKGIVTGVALKKFIEWVRGKPSK